MKTRKLLKLSLIVALVGLFILIILVNNVEPDSTAISNINERMLDQWVKITGEVTNSKEISTEMGKLTLFTVQDYTDSISVVFYDEIELSDNAEVTGTVSEYEGQIQIIARKIRCF
ncbi:MAG: hypothetical protein JSW08_03235 [archaeon]|nr:MAG: hypothetical protein JSW08_03235 [archaeon]